jgi:hypothetical protein
MFAEIPQKMRWTRTFPWPRLKHGYTWRVPRKLDDPKSFTVLMPVAQGQTAILTGTRISEQGEILADKTTKTPTATYVTNNIQDGRKYILGSKGLVEDGTWNITTYIL